MKKLNEKIIITVIIALTIIGYALITQQTKIEVIREKDEIVRDMEKKRKQSLSRCFSQVRAEALDIWGLNCESRGADIKRNKNGKIISCSLPMYLSDSLEKEENREKDRCLEINK